MNLSEHFTLDELNKHKFDLPDEVLDNLKMLAVQLEIVRAHFNVPVTINSGYRNLEYNRNIGSKDTSQHIKVGADVPSNADNAVNVTVLVVAAIMTRIF